MSDAAVSWQIEGDGAKLRCGPLEAFAGCDSEGLRFIVQKWNGQLVEGISVLASGGPTERSKSLDVAERYVRVQDFVASYKPTGGHRVAPHVYWRASFDNSRSAGRVELVLSAQTELLDSGPAWPVSSFVTGAKLLHASDLKQPSFDDLSTAAKKFDSAKSSQHLFVFRSVALGLSYAQMVHPSDFVSAEVSRDGNQRQFVNSTLFPERLEKGVIRRGRICGWFMPAENDLETAVALARQFVEEPLPLTT